MFDSARLAGIIIYVALYIAFLIVSAMIVFGLVNRLIEERKRRKEKKSGDWR